MRSFLLGAILFFAADVGYALGNCAYEYIPPHTTEELLEVRTWAIGGAFIQFADEAGYTFDSAAYMADAPNIALFNFGMVTNTTCLELDVMTGFFSAMTHLAQVWQKHKDPNTPKEMSFQEAYTRIATSYGFDKYLAPAGVDI